MSGSATEAGGVGEEFCRIMYGIWHALHMPEAWAADLRPRGQTAAGGGDEPTVLGDRLVEGCRGMTHQGFTAKRGHIEYIP